ncbi:type IV secretion system protein [Leptotrichia sp. OH3620_COT-345]|uniref:type IV secretion system protein n=1 Tax=Leptotrichia sp. OH3620_COT-345 TaxID=2491048 RepID=UPI000F64E66A|nr:type IV secretion system protein [Leptotrichia sp. OH3620_COT-345]RRD39837.1 type IV secretion system protein [Leptotrichia sp. OH3620_COT-345]
MDIKEIKKMKEKYEFGNLENSKGMSTSVEMMYHVTVKIQSLLKTLYLIIICLTITNAVTLIGLIYRSVKNPYIPYAVRIDKDGAVNGQVLAGQQNMNVSDNIIEYFLVDFIKKTRTVYKDRNFYQSQTKEKMSFVNNIAKSKIEDFINNKTNTDEVLRNQKSISVEVESFVKIDTNKYQVTFIERTYSQSGIPEREAKYTMVAFLDYIPVGSNAMVRMNPLGIIIKDAEFGTVSTSQRQVQTIPSTSPIPPVTQ